MVKGQLHGIHSGGGPTLGPMLKSLQRGPKSGGPDPPPPGSAPEAVLTWRTNHESGFYCDLVEPILTGPG